LLKSEVRKISAELNLDLANKQESQNFVCGNYASLFDEESEPGPLLDRHGHILGQHRGIVHYTFGQRRGLGISSDEPAYVIDIKPESNTIIVGQKEDLYRTGQAVHDLNWISIDSLTNPKEIRARIRSTHSAYAAVISPLDDNRVLVTYREPQIAAARGQSIVFYDGDMVLGGGIAC
jgi:tRNA-specific 2-thiouridylase